MARIAASSFPASLIMSRRAGTGARRRSSSMPTDYRLYCELRVAAAKSGTMIWAYCLMPNHVHVIATPTDHRGLWRTFREVHRRYTGQINARNPKRARRL